MGFLCSVGFLSTSASGMVGLGDPCIPSWLLVVVVVVVPLLAVGGVEGQTVPEVLCGIDIDCAGKLWTWPLPECVSFRCRCPKGTCVVFSISSSGDDVYYCGQCGTLGSECNGTLECGPRWECSGDFCKCTNGYVHFELCVVYQAVPTSVNSFVLIVILAVLLLIQKLIHSRKAIKKCICRSSRDSGAEETRAVGYNPDTNNKTAAFTITNSDFMATTDDPDLEWGLELSRALSSSGENWYAMSGSTWSSLQSSTGSTPHAHSPDARSPDARTRADSPQPGTSGLRPRSASSGNRSATPSRPHHRCSIHTSISSTSSNTSVAPPDASRSFSRVRSCASQSSGTSFSRSSPSSLTSNL